MRRADGSFGAGARGFSRDHLFLQDVSIQVEEEWTNPPNGLAFVFPRAGAGTCTAGAASHALEPGAAAILSSTPGSRLRAPGNQPLAFSFFTASIDQLYPLFGSHELHRLQQVEERLGLTKFNLAPAGVAKQCHTLLREVPRQQSLEHRGHLMRVAGVLLANEINDVAAPADGYVSMEEHLRQVWETLTLDDMVSLSVSELASRFGCSRRHLTRLFHQHFGMSVVALRMEVRLLKAASLLREPSVKVIQVAEQCGFYHLGLFGTCFKRRFGVNPREWRKQVLQGMASAPPLPLTDNRSCNFARTGLCPWQRKAASGSHWQSRVNGYARSGNGSPVPDCNADDIYVGSGAAWARQ